MTTPDRIAYLRSLTDDSENATDGMLRDALTEALDLLASAEARRGDVESFLRSFALDLARATGLDGQVTGEQIVERVRALASAETEHGIACTREPTEIEGDAYERIIPPSGAPDDDGDLSGECFVPVGGWTGRRCRECRRWVWGGPTACERCVIRERLREAEADLAALRARLESMPSVLKAEVPT